MVGLAVPRLLSPGGRGRDGYVGSAQTGVTALLILAYSRSDIEEVSLGAQLDGTPIRVRDVGFVQLGPDIRRGAVDYNGLGDAAGGVVVVRFGENVYDVLQRVKHGPQRLGARRGAYQGT